MYKSVLWIHLDLDPVYFLKCYNTVVLGKKFFKNPLFKVKLPKRNNNGIGGHF